MRYRGPLYRALNPVYARTPLSGEGAARYGGRFNPRGVAALYTALDVIGALREANQVGSLQPTTLVSYDTDIDNIFDSRDGAALAAFGMDAGALADPGWREHMRAGGEAPTQTFARRLIDAGRNGLLVRSFAKGAGPDDLNLVLWHWDKGLRLIDDENRLARL